MRKRPLPWAIAVVCVVLGFMLSMQFKVQSAKETVDTAGIQRSKELVGQLQKAEQERDSLMTEVEDLRVQMRNMANNQAQFKDLAQQLQLAQLHAGLIPVTGTGVLVTMNDSSRPVTPGENSANYIIHDEDVLKVVNELAAAGAEAISINGQRLIGRTEIRCTGPTITINGVRTAPPVAITAIGNADSLEAALTMKDGVLQNLNRWIEISVKKDMAANVPAFKGSLKLQYGLPVTQEVSKK